MHNAPRPWGEAEDAKMVKLWTEGFSAAQVARLLGTGRSRNAVIGRIHRKGLQGRSKDQRDRPGAATRIKARRQASMRFIPSSVLKPVRMKLADADTAELRDLEPVCFEGGPRTILTVQPGECRYTAGEGADAPLCGRATGYGPWCSQHIRLVYQPSRKRELQNASIARVTRRLDRKNRTAEAYAA